MMCHHAINNQINVSQQCSTHRCEKFHVQKCVTCLEVVKWQFQAVPKLVSLLNSVNDPTLLWSSLSKWEKTTPLSHVSQCDNIRDLRWCIAIMKWYRAKSNLAPKMCFWSHQDIMCIVMHAGIIVLSLQGNTTTV